MTKDDLIQIGIVSIGGAVTAFALVFMVKVGVGQESLFALIGALIGATTTIGGSIWLNDRNRAIERDAEIDIVTNEFDKLLASASAAQIIQPAKGQIWPDEYRPLLYKLADIAGRVHAILAEALIHAKALSFIHRASLRRVQFTIDQYLQFWTDANAEDDLHPMDERNFPDLTEDIIRECQLAIGELQGLPLAPARD